MFRPYLFHDTPIIPPLLIVRFLYENWITLLSWRKGLASSFVHINVNFNINFIKFRMVVVGKRLASIERVV